MFAVFLNLMWGYFGLMISITLPGSLAAWAPSLCATGTTRIFAYSSASESKCFDSESTTSIAISGLRYLNLATQIITPAVSTFVECAAGDEDKDYKRRYPGKARNCATSVASRQCKFTFTPEDGRAYRCCQEPSPNLLGRRDCGRG